MEERLFHHLPFQMRAIKMRVSSVLILSLFLLSEKALGDSEGDVSVTPPSYSASTEPEVKPWSDWGHRGQANLASPLCELRGRCGGVEANTSTFFSRNCFCDTLCNYYDDCCDDYRSPEGASAFAHLPRGVATCQRMDDIETGYTIDAYKVSKCPKDFGDRHIRRLCESEVGPKTSERFFLLPVTGNTSLVLYRNIYCAVCSGERNPVFWLGKLRCGGGSHQRLNRTSDLRQFIRAACPIEFAPVREWAGNPGAPRRCKPHIGRCDRDWTDDDVRQKCRHSTNYVYVGNRAFRNKHCAHCNHVNETYLRCDDVRSTPQIDVTSGGFFEQTAAFVVTIDFNRGSAVVTETKTGSGYVAERPKDFPTCTGEGSVYDPFADVCRKTTCTPEMEFPPGRCLPKPLAEEQNDRAADDMVKSRDSQQLESAAVNDDDDDDIKEDNEELKENVTEYSIFAQEDTIATVAIETTIVTSESVPFEPMSARFVLFRMDSLQRLLSIMATLFCLLCLIVYVVLYLLYSELRSEPANRYAICFSICLMVAHLLFIFVVLPNQDFPGPLACFCLSLVIQYAYMTAFFWLSVMSIDSFKRLIQDPQSNPEHRQNHCVSFSVFSLYAWLVPAVAMAGSTAIAVLKVDGWDQLYKGKTTGCFVLGLSQLLLFVVPVSLVIVTNVTMYVIVTCRICFEPRPTRKDPERFRQESKDRKRFLICVQLTVVMTTTWVMAFVAYLTGLSFLWYVFIVFDAIQGLSVCLAFVWKVKVWHLFNGRSVKITKQADNLPKNRHQTSDGLDGSIEPFVDPLPLPEGDAPSNASNNRLDTILRETSI